MTSDWSCDPEGLVILALVVKNPARECGRRRIGIQLALWAPWQLKQGIDPGRAHDCSAGWLEDWKDGGDGGVNGWNNEGLDGWSSKGLEGWRDGGLTSLLHFNWCTGGKEWNGCTPTPPQPYPLYIFPQLSTSGHVISPDLHWTSSLW